MNDDKTCLKLVKTSQQNDDIVNINDAIYHC